VGRSETCPDHEGRIGQVGAQPIEVEASLVRLGVAVVDAVVGGQEATRVAVLAIAAITWVMVVAHLTSILSSSVSTATWPAQ
jgi:hypothetical protein